MTAALGVAVGAGRIGLALLSVGLGLIILYVLHRVEIWCTTGKEKAKHNKDRRADPGSKA